MKHALVLGLALFAAACGEKRDLPVAEIDCRSGLYLSADGAPMALSPLDDDGAYRWRRLDGATGALTPDGERWRNTIGWTDEADGLVADLGTCDSKQIFFGAPGAMDTYARAPLEVTDIKFEHDGLTFSGRLIWPASTPRATLAVHVHGSERWSATRNAAVPYLLAAQGIASFVYDKRGTGQSEGRYTQDFHVLASDAIAALAAARSLAGDKIDRAGYIGGSQGGWIGPLAASKSDVDFVVALFGMAESPLAEDRGQVIRDVADAGFDPEAQQRAAALSDAAGVVMASDFKRGYGEFDRLRRLYRNEPWYRSVEGEFTGEMLPYPAFALRILGPFFDIGTSWEYEPVAVLRSLEIPQLWMIAGDDAEAPPGETIRRLRALQAEGAPLDLAVYPGADHGMIRVEVVGAERRELGHVENYFGQLGAWIRSRDLSLARAAGAEVTSGTGAPPAEAPAP